MAERISISLSSDDRDLIETAAQQDGVSISAWLVDAAREKARWTMARKISTEIADEVGVTADDLAWAAEVLGVDR